MTEHQLGVLRELRHKWHAVIVWTKVERLKALFKRRKAEKGLFHLEEKNGMEYVMPNKVDYDKPTVLRLNPEFRTINRI